MKTVTKSKHAAGGFVFKLTNDEKTNVRFGQEKLNKISKALKSSDTEGVYQRPNGQVVRQFLNGNSVILF